MGCQSEQYTHGEFGSERVKGVPRVNDRSIASDSIYKLIIVLIIALINDLDKKNTIF